MAEGGLTELDQGLGTPGMLGSRFHQAGFGKKRGSRVKS